MSASGGLDGEDADQVDEREKHREAGNGRGSLEMSVRNLPLSSKEAYYKPDERDRHGSQFHERNSA